MFTPLVSPAVTPLDTNFQYPDYAAPPDAFSPLTSPALRAQNHAGQHSVYGAIRGSDASDTTSPIDPNLDYPIHTSAVPLRKSKRKTSSSSTKNPARTVRQYPAMKPQRRKQPSSTIIPPKEISGIIEEARKSTPGTRGPDGNLPLPYSQDSSGADSVSPEPLSEILMPPPATPKSNSASRSPYLDAKPKGPQDGQPASMPDANGKPATPASLMKIREQAGKANGARRKASSLKEQTAAAEADMEQIMEDIVLPEPAKEQALRPIDTANANLESSTPTMSARKTPRCGPASAPITATSSAFPSPQLGAMSSPTSAGPGKRAESGARVRDPKKRNSQGSVQVSPALRPKISPSIKPLLPEGGKLLLPFHRLYLQSNLTTLKQQSCPPKPPPSSSPPNQTTKISSKAPTSPASPTPKPSPQTLPRNAHHTKSPNKAVAIASIPLCKKSPNSCPQVRPRSMVAGEG